jgi:hypothetical protein
MLTFLTAPALVELLCVRTVIRTLLSLGMLLLGSYNSLLTCEQAWPGAGKFKVWYISWFVI